jgi:hypothetical protein
MLLAKTDGAASKVLNIVMAMMSKVEGIRRFTTRLYLKHNFNAKRDLYLLSLKA